MRESNADLDSGLHLKDSTDNALCAFSTVYIYKKIYMYIYILERKPVA